ncbi:peptidase inhibitor family I36 protein [Streptomyces albiaxialis]
MAVLVVAASGLLAAPGAASAQAEPVRVTDPVSEGALAAPSCTSNICTWTGYNYTGRKLTSGLNPGVCYHSLTVKSVVNRHRVPVRYYSDSRCRSTGRFTFKSRKTLSNIPILTGFIPHSYKRA